MTNDWVQSMLNEKIKKLRLSYNLSQVDIANRLGVSKQCVSNWENDNVQPSIEMLVNIAKLFNVSADYLLDLDEKELLDVQGLSEKEIAHIKLLIQDLLNKS